ncbi:phosphatase PAP2 family protein [Brenneria izadpanahii]|uniref:Phosphatase PAP2 family protein n=1 Tax=Brenneria izadpanahii TaxID=2722756 RepID=A0ABX7UXS1_9GAMM|nr:phosphatase PAP2 family protein [Brenneria izadpanahii]QTF08463.1 phosphatase PAP2 family protein [Brenneria izadpanahii]
MRYSRPMITMLGSFLIVHSAWSMPPSTQISDIGAIVDTTTPASKSHQFSELELNIQAALRQALQGSAPSLTRPQLETAKQSDRVADTQWLHSINYDFAEKKNQQADIEILSAFSQLPADILQKNLATVTQINRDATQGQREQALADAEGINYLYFLADALGPRLGNAFITAYNQGEISKAAALIKASEVSTSAAKAHFNYPRPFLQPDNTIHLVPDNVVVKDNKPYSATGGAFPSGHTNTGYTDALLLAEMLPERFVPLIDRGARYGFSRVVLGVHYPLDVIGSRMVVERNIAHYLNDPQYRQMFEQAKTQLRTALEKECGMTLSACAKSEGRDDPYTDPAMTTFYRFTMTYGLPAQHKEATPVKVPDGAEVLLEAPLPNLSATERKRLMVKTAYAGGYPLSGSDEQSFWHRLNLHDAVRQATH